MMVDSIKKSDGFYASDAKKLEDSSRWDITPWQEGDYQLRRGGRKAAAYTAIAFAPLMLLLKDCQEYEARERRPDISIAYSQAAPTRPVSVAVPEPQQSAVTPR